MRRPRFIAAQARHAKGPTGRLIAWIMARETRPDNLRAIEALELLPTDNVLDVGTGHGRALGEIAARTPRGLATGIDPSALMIEIARSRNARLVRGGRVRVEQAEVERLPFPDATFDKVMAVHALYFWSDLTASLRQIARVLRPGGRLVVVFRSAADERAASSFPSDIYRFPSIAELSTALEAESFIVERVEEGGEPAAPKPVLVLATKRG